MLPTLPFGESAHSVPSISTTLREYSVKAYYLPHYFASSSSPSAPNRLIDAFVKLQPSEWNIDLHYAFPSGISTDSYFIGGPTQNWPTPPCFCGKMPKIGDGQEAEEESGEWDQYWDCTAVCKLRRRHQVYMQDQERRYGEELEDNSAEYILFVEGDGETGQEDIPLLERESRLEELEVPVFERGMVVVKMENRIPVDLEPVIVDDQTIRYAGEDEMVYFKKFLKGICNNEATLERRFHQQGVGKGIFYKDEGILTDPLLSSPTEDSIHLRTPVEHDLGI